MKKPLFANSSFWSKPFVFLRKPGQKWFYIAFFTFFVPFFLLVFQPFGVNNYDPTHKIGLTFLLASLGFGLVCGVTLALYEFLIAPKMFRRNNIMSFVLRLGFGMLLVAAALFLFYNFLGNFHDWRLSSFIGFIRDVFLMAILPVGIIILYLKYRSASLAFQNLKIQPIAQTEGKLIWFAEGNETKKLAITLNDLRFIEAQDNYVAVHYLENNLLKKTLLRATMKKLQLQLQQDRVVRCHRSYIVNLGSVIKITKNNANQYRLYLSDVETSLPVSRSYNSSLGLLLNVHHK